MSTFGRQFKVAFCKAYRIQPNTPHSTRVNNLDFDQFRSFLIDFRKLVLVNEPANFYRVLGILGRYGNGMDRERIKQIKRALRNVSESVAGACCGIEEQHDHYRQVRPKEMVDTYFKGVLFHNDLAFASEVEFFKRADAFAVHAMLHYVVFLYKQALRLAGSIRLRGMV